MDCNYFKKKRDEILLSKKFTSNYSNINKHVLYIEKQEKQIKELQNKI
jgi:hypothetical protein